MTLRKHCEKFPAFYFFPLLLVVTEGINGKAYVRNDLSSQSYLLELFSGNGSGKKIKKMNTQSVNHRSFMMLQMKNWQLK
jgi:hypothetical protein